MQIARFDYLACSVLFAILWLCFLIGFFAMQTLTANDAKRNFGELLLNAQREPIKISKNSKDTVVVMSIRDFEALELMKADYLKHCFKAAQEDLAQGKAVDGETFLRDCREIT